MPSTAPAEPTITPKEYVLQILDLLQDVWPVAKGLKVLLQKGTVDEATIDALAGIFRQVIEGLEKEEHKDVFKKGLSMIEKLKHKEILHKEAEEAELFDLENMINQL